MLGSSSRRRLASAFVALVSVVASAGPALANGTLSLDVYRPIPQAYLNATPPAARPGGLEIVADYTLDPDCDCTNTRWLQLVQLTNPTTGAVINTVPGFPNGVFIDPQPGTNLGGAVIADKLPWYDPTYNNDPLGNNPGAIQNGAGPWLYDLPNGWANFGPISFTATTLVVCTDDTTNKIAQVLGGFTWGFTINAQNAATNIMAAAAVNVANALNLFNGAGNNGPLPTFNAGDNAANAAAGQGWTLAALAANDPCALDFDASAVPSPAASAGGLLMLCLLFSCRRMSAWSQNA